MTKIGWINCECHSSGSRYPTTYQTPCRKVLFNITALQTGDVCRRNNATLPNLATASMHIRLLC